MVQISNNPVAEVIYIMQQNAPLELTANGTTTTGNGMLYFKYNI